jgi:hypothetical protein
MTEVAAKNVLLKYFPSLKVDKYHKICHTECGDIVLDDDCGCRIVVDIFKSQIVFVRISEPTRDVKYIYSGGRWWIDYEVQCYAVNYNPLEL